MSNITKIPAIVTTSLNFEAFNFLIKGFLSKVDTHTVGTQLDLLLHQPIALFQSSTAVTNAANASGMMYQKS